MESDTGPGDRRTEDFVPRTVPEQRDGTAEEAPNVDRLPPPMFPPGSRRRHLRRVVPESSEPPREDEASGIPDDAFILPDEPISRPGGGPSEEATSSAADEWSREEAEGIDGAFIHPDTPIVRTGPPSTPADYEDVLRGQGSISPEEVVVTGIGDDPHLEDEELERLEHFGDVYVADLSAALDRLADAVRVRGEAGLKSSPDMSPFEVTLRAYCVGYLSGRREEE